MTTAVSPTVARVLDPEPCHRLADYVAAGGGTGLEAARAQGPRATIEAVAASGLRGRGGAGFPTGVKWQTVAAAASQASPTPVIVNAAEGEPGTFKDRELLRRNPFRVLEGALIAARAVGAREVVVAVKASFSHERDRLELAIAEMVAAGWSEGVDLRVVPGPGAYLFGEETALLEVVEGRPPFPRVTPPYRRGLDPNDQPARRSASAVHLAGAGGTDEPPALVDNVETLANVPGIVAHGPDWFRRLGTEQSPGTIVCTVTGATHHHGVGEVPMGTPLRAIVDEIGGGARTGHTLVAVVSGVANPFVPAALLDTPASYEGMAAIGSGLGSAGFIVFDDESDMAAVAQAASRFLAVESCGQCEPCKLDGLKIAEHLDAIRTSNATERDLRIIRGALETVDRGARCSLAGQQRRVVGSALALFPEAFGAHLDGRRAASGPELVAPIVDIVGGHAVLDTSHFHKQPDWSFGLTSSGSFPVDLLTDQPVRIRPARVTEMAPADGRAAVVPPGADDPFHEVRVGHACILESLARLRDAQYDAAAMPAVLHELRRHLQVHDDITNRVLYPMLARAAGAAGEEASTPPRDEVRAALHRVEQMLRDGPGGASEVAADVEAITTLVERHVEAAEHDVLPLLHDRLDSEHRARLRDALALAMKWRSP